MSSRALALAFLAVFTSTRPSTASGQACRQADSVSQWLVDLVGHFASATDPHDVPVRDSLRLPATPARDVRLVIDEAVCQKAGAAYAEDRGRTGGAGLSGRVYVVQVSMAYAVLDPAFYYDARRRIPVVLVLDSTYRTLSIF
jgi:hypothetical protein